MSTVCPGVVGLTGIDGSGNPVDALGGRRIIREPSFVRRCPRGRAAGERS
jgi:hypothetical protein